MKTFSLLCCVAIATALLIPDEGQGQAKPPAPSQKDFQIDVDVSRPIIKIYSPVAVSANITNMSSVRLDSIRVHIEAYDEHNNRLDERVFDNQSFLPGTPRACKATFSFDKATSVVFKIG